MPQAVEIPGERAGSSYGGLSVSFCASADDQMSFAASEGELESGYEDSAVLPPSERLALSEPDPKLMAMLSLAAKLVRHEWSEPPCPEPSRLNYWYLGVARAGPQPHSPVHFFLQVHEEVTRSWKAKPD